MKLVPLKPFPPGANPFLHDIQNMGTRVASNVMIMHMSHDTEKTNWIVIVNTDTGERVRVDLDEPTELDNMLSQG